MTESANERLPEATRLRKLVAKQKLDELEAAWLEAVEAQSVDLTDFVAVLQAVAKRDPKLAESMLWFLLTGLADQPAKAVDVLRQTAALVAGNPDLRQLTAKVYAATFKELPAVDAMIQMTVLRPDLPFPAAVEALEKLVQFKPGSYVHDTRFQKPGRIAGVDPERKILEVTFDDRTRTYDGLAVDRLQALASLDFDAMVAFEAESLRQLGTTDPAALVKLVLKTFGPRLEFKELKSRLGPVIPQPAWAKWWNKAKPAIRREPLIEMADATQPYLFLRNRPVTFEEELQRQFERTEDPEEKLLVVLDYLTETESRAAQDTALLASFAAALTKLGALWWKEMPAFSLCALAVADKIAARQAGAASGGAEAAGGAVAAALPAEALAIPTLLASQADLASVTRPIINDRLAGCLLDAVRRQSPERWTDIWAGLMPGLPQALCARVADELVAAGELHKLERAVEALMDRGERYASAMIWLWKSACGGDHPEVTAEIDTMTVTVRMFSAINRLARETSLPKAKQLSLLTQARAAITAREYENLRRLMKTATPDEAIRLRQAVDRNAGLTDHVRLIVMEAVTHAHPALFATKVPAWEEDVVYTTAAGFKRAQLEFAHIVNIKMSENNKAIAAAAALGDLSENSEYTYALEERDRLSEKANRLQSDLDKSRVIRPETLVGDRVTIGSMVTVRNLATQVVETWTFLGPWDTDPEHRIYSYRAALALAFMGKLKGEEVSLSTGEETRSWVIQEIRPADLGPVEQS